LIINTELDKGLDTSNTQEITCKFNNEEGWHKDNNKHYCGRIKYHYPGKEGCILLDKNIFSQNIDFCVTNEYFGSGCSAGKINIISKKVYEIIKNNKLKGLKIYPIMYKN
jgi:hypothetical protein